MHLSQAETVPHLKRSIPQKRERNLRILPDNARAMTTVIQGGRGTGKSRMFGRVLTWQDAVRGYPTILFDPTGGSIANFLDKLILVLKDQGVTASELERRVVYLDVSGQSGYTLGFPICTRIAAESIYTQAQRFADAIILTNPQLQNASIEGANRIRKLSTYVCMILFALDCQITEAHSLLTEPEKWKPLFGRAIRTYPEVKKAIEFFEQEYMSLPERERASRLDAFLGKLLMFIDPATAAMFGTSISFSWEDVVTERKIVLLDFSKELDLEKRRFKMFWIFSSLIEYVKYRGIGKSLTPIAIYVDELTAMLNLDSASGGEAFANYLDELINIISRNANIWLTFAFQQWFQLPERLRQTLLTAGTLLLGNSSDLAAARHISAMLWEYDPFLVKKIEPIIMQDHGSIFEAGQRNIEYSIDEQVLLNAYKLLKLPKFHFLARIARGEGDIHAPLQELTIENIDRGQWVQEEKVERAKAILAAHTGQPIDTILAEISSRQKELKVLTTQAAKSARMNKYGNPPSFSSSLTNSTTQENNHDDDLY